LDEDNTAQLPWKVVDEIVGNGGYERLQRSDVDRIDSRIFQLEPVIPNTANIPTHYELPLPEAGLDHAGQRSREWDGDESGPADMARPEGLLALLWGIIRGVGGTRNTESRDGDLEGIRAGKRK
jgi:hypothetical protein